MVSASLKLIFMGPKELNMSYYSYCVGTQLNVSAANMAVFELQEFQISLTVPWLRLEPATRTEAKEPTGDTSDSQSRT